MNTGVGLLLLAAAMAGRPHWEPTAAAVDQYNLAVDALQTESGDLRIFERVEGGQYQVSVCKGAPVVLAWATGSLPEPPNNPQVGMMNMRTIMPSLQQAKTLTVSNGDVAFDDVALPSQRRETRVVKDTPAEEIADEIIEWLRK